MYSQARAILWAQWRTLVNFYPRTRRGWVVWTALISTIWYGGWCVLAVAAAFVMRDPGMVQSVHAVLPGALLMVFLYWQVIPLMMAATGASLDLRRLVVYPIPHSQLFTIEVMLRLTTGIEMLLLITGAGAGLLLNPRIPPWAPLGFLPFILFNLFIAAGVRDLLSRLLARKRVREIAFLALVLLAALPQLLLTRSVAMDARIKALFSSEQAFWWPWTATAHLVHGRDFLAATGVAGAWTAAAFLFGRWQFTRSLRFDAQAAQATVARAGPRGGWVERVFRLPSALLADPLGALVEKEIRSLTRAPRFRLVFLMGFTFGLLIWLPMAFGRPGGPASALSRNYLTFVSVYSLLLLGEVCFWNAFGFDRSAAQVYFLAPVRFSTVLIAKNISAVFFILLEMTAITLVCGLLRMPLEPRSLAEAYSVTLVVSVFLLSAGNLTSIYQARAVNPASSFRTSSAGRLQALLLVVYPVAALPVLLSYLARYAFDSQAAFYAVLAFDAAIGAVVYWVALDSAVDAVEKKKEEMLAALAQGEGPIAV